MQKYCYVILSIFSFARIPSSIIKLAHLKISKLPLLINPYFCTSIMTVSFDIQALDSWLPSESRPIIISGPCSAETEEQVMKTARQLARIPQVKVFRSGIWKPRTRPHGFEGVGETGLRWLQQVKAETGLLTTVEVATPKHVELALKYGIDILWIGARTVVNPFSVQEVSEALRGIDLPVLVKNPVSPDLNLWIGGLERVNKAGVKKIAAIHRGFYFFVKTPYRNAPMWEVPIELKRRFPELPVFVDPSHISGKRSMIEEIAQKALDLEMNGLMIESHINPDDALSDAEQQITPEELQGILDRLKLRKETGEDFFESKLEELRSEIDKIDAELLEILARRLEFVSEIGKYKKENNITILQLKRWQNIIRERMADGTSRGMSEEFLRQMLELVHNESIRIQNEIMNRGEQGEKV
jgi:chorismate mutase